MTLKPQLRKILNHVARVGYITQRAAIDDYGIMALPRRMKDLAELGYVVKTELKNNPATGQRYTRYRIEDTSASVAASLEGDA